MLSILASLLSDRKSSIEEMKRLMAEQPVLEPSPIRIMDLGKNYFRHINPRKKKTMLLLMDAYVENLSEADRPDF